MKDIVVVDLDGTLCDCAHREHLARAKEWDEFHSRACDDKPHRDVVTVVDALSRAGYLSIVALTGRNARWHAETIEWLAHYQIAIDVVLMRPDGNFEPDKVIKPKLLAEFCAKEQVLFILEDRDAMVEHWRNLGFRCWQTQAGGY